MIFFTVAPDVHQVRRMAAVVILEYGITDLFGKNLKQRAKALIELAHPDHRDALERAVYERFYKELMCQERSLLLVLR